MKLILKILAAIVAVLLVAILALVFLFDLNMFKPKIEAAARAQGVDLQINGDLGWTFWPSVGVTVEDIRVAGLDTPDQPIAQLKQASLLVALMPLFSGDIQAHHVRIDGAVINLAVDQQGAGNWEALTAERPEATITESDAAGDASLSSPQVADETPGEAKELKLAIDRVSLLNSSLNYRDEQSGQVIAIADIQLDVRQFNMDGQPFDMSLAFKTTLSDDTQRANQSLVVALELANRAQLSPEFETLQVNDGALTLTINDKGRFSANYSLKVDDLQDSMRFSGELDVPTFNAKKLLTAMGGDFQTNEKNALTAVAMEAKFAGNKQSMTIEPLELQLDKTRIKGKLAITDFETSAIQLALSGDEINIDDYLAPANQETPSTPASSGDEELIPLEAVRTLNADARVDFAKVIVAGMPLESIQFRLTAKNGQVNIQQADAQLYEGSIASTGSIDSRGNTAVIRFDSKINDVQLAPAMKDLELDEKIKFNGAINANAMGNARGVTMNQIMDSLTAEANLTGEEVRFSPLNVEQKFCQVINLVSSAEADPQRAWEDFTEMRQLSGKITMAQRVINVESFNAGVHQLVMGTEGKVNLATDEYDFTLPLKLLEEETSENGCRVASNYWINRSLSLIRCRGSLDTLNPVQDCRPDKQGLLSLTKDFAEFKIREKHGDKIDAAEQRLDEKKDELREKLDEKVGTETEGQKPRDLLKSLINKRLEKEAESRAEKEAKKNESEPAPAPAPEATPEAAPETVTEPTSDAEGSPATP